jgi:hypothetical protein
VAYRVAGDLEKKYANNNIDLPEIPGEPSGRWLPVPAIFVIGKDGVIRFAEFNVDYKVRPPPDEILAAAASAMSVLRP